MIADLRRQADHAAQEALRDLVRHRFATGQWDRHLSARYRAAEQLVDMLDEQMVLEEAAAHDASWFDPSEGESFDPLPDAPVAMTPDPGDHFAWPA